MNINTTDKVQVGDSTTGTSTSTSYTISSKPSIEYGWACPRCSKVNAPWKSQCDCAGNYYYSNWYTPWEYKEPWWKQIYCESDTFKVHPETTTWKAPSSMCGSDSNSTYKSDNLTTAWNTNSAMDTGGSDYWNSVTKNWENVPKTYTNQVEDMVNRIDHITTTTTTFYNTGDNNNAL